MSLGDRSYENILPAPLVFTEDVVVELVFEDGSAIRATAQELRLDLIGSPFFVDQFP